MKTALAFEEAEAIMVVLARLVALVRLFRCANVPHYYVGVSI